MHFTTIARRRCAEPVELLNALPAACRSLSLQDHALCQLHASRALCPSREHGAQSHLHTFGLKLATACTPWSGVQDARVPRSGLLLRGREQLGVPMKNAYSKRRRFILVAGAVASIA